MSEQQTNHTPRELISWVNTRITGILSMPEGGAQRALLARLRRGVGKAPGELPELWGVLFEDFPAEWMSGSGQATRSEWAAYIALTLFAMHQQSKDPKTAPMHRKGQSLGRALNRLAGDDHEEKERILRRFRQLAAAADIRGAAYHLRGLVQLLRGADIPLDYAALAWDLYQYQDIERMADVRLRWAQDFYRFNMEENGKEEQA